MKEATIRWTFYSLGLLVVGPMAGVLTGSVRAADGSGEATAFVAAGFLGPILATLGAMLLAGVFGCVAAAVCGFRSGLICAGMVLSWAAWRTATLDQLLRWTGPGALWALAAEGVLVGALGVGIVLAARAAARPMIGDNWRDPAESADGEKTIPAAAVVGVGVIVAAVIATIIAISELKGQTIAAAGLGAMLATTAMCVLARRQLAHWPIFVLAALAAAGPAVGAIHHGSQITAAVQAGTALGLVRVMPMDWIAGGLLGIPLGLAWASSLLKQNRA